MIPSTGKRIVQLDELLELVNQQEQNSTKSTSKKKFKKTVSK